MISIQHVRRLACALLLSAAACGDDGGDDDTPKPDAGPAEAGAGDAGADGSAPAADGGNIDGGGGGDPDGGDARAAIDTGIPDPISDAGNQELQAALNREGIRTDMQRAALVLPAFCRRGALCGFGATGITEASCLMTIRASWNESVSDQDTPQCQDALLDYWSCGAVVQCDMQGSCGPLFGYAETVCSGDGDGGV